MEKILCLPHQLGMISIDGVDVPISVVLWDSDGADVPIDNAVVVADTVAGADAAQSLFYWIEALGTAPPGTVVGGALHVLETATGEGLAISNSGTSLSGTHSRGFASAAYATLATAPIRISPGETIVFGRERAITPAGSLGGSGGGGGSTLDVFDTAGASGTQAVSTSVLRVLGATNWTLATTNGTRKRIVQVTNCSASDVLYLKSIANATSLTGAVSATDYDVKIAAGGTVPILVLAGQDLACLRSSGSDNVRAKEYLAA